MFHSDESRQPASKCPIYQVPAALKEGCHRLFNGLLINLASILFSSCEGLPSYPPCIGMSSTRASWPRGRSGPHLYYRVADFLRSNVMDTTLQLGKLQRRTTDGYAQAYPRPNATEWARNVPQLPNGPRHRFAVSCQNGRKAQ